MRLSIVIPVINEAANIGRTLVVTCAAVPPDTQIIVVDGGSTDGTADAARKFLGSRHQIKLIQSAPGRAQQMNAGAALAAGDVLLFLHADTLLPLQAGRAILEGIGAGNVVWGRFDVRIEGRPRMLRVVAFCMNLRSRLTGIATGDQAIFVRRQVFLAVGGFCVQPLMEDIEMSRSLKRQSVPLCLRERVLTSGRRWETHGVWRTIFLMWRLRLLYWLGASAAQLKQAYR